MNPKAYHCSYEGTLSENVGLVSVDAVEKVSLIFFLLHMLVMLVIHIAAAAHVQSLKTRFLDTLSLHVCVSGQANSQKGMWKAKNKAASDEHEDAIHGEHHSVGLGGMAKKKVYKTYDPSQTWMRVSCPNSLMDVHGFYVKESKRRVSKKLRDVFVKGSIQDIRDDFQVV